MSFSQRVRERAGEPDPVEAYQAMSDYRRAALMLWIRLTIAPRKTVNISCTSYGLKHDAEDEIGTYISNAEFKGAMVAAGFEPENGNLLNWEFRIRRRHRRRTGGHTGFLLDRERLSPVEVALFEVVASWARMREDFDNRDRRAAAGLDYETGPIATERDREAFRRARDLGLRPLIPRRVYAAVVEGRYIPRGRVRGDRRGCAS